MTDVAMPLLGGIMIGLGSVIALAASGKIPGISGIVARVMTAKSGDTGWRVVFLLGLLLGAGAVAFSGFGWQGYSLPEGRGLGIYAIAGLLVGFGTRIGGGCTSGHGVCGIGAGAKDGLIYTLVFMATGVATVWLWGSLTNGGTSL